MYGEPTVSTFLGFTLGYKYSTVESAHMVVEKVITVMLNWLIPFLKALHWPQ